MKMAKNNNFNPIDSQTWPRGQMFDYFSKIASTGYSLTVELDVTVLRLKLYIRFVENNLVVEASEFRKECSHYELNME